MKVIDLFNGMHNGAIKDGTKFYLNFQNGLRRECYINKKGNFGFIYQVSDKEPCQDYISLDDDVEIIEEDEEIEELDLGQITPNGEYVISVETEKIQDKINELIKEVNKLKKEGK